MTGLPDPRQRPLLTVAEAATALDMGEKAVRAAVKAAQLPSLRIGRYVLVPTAPLYELLGLTPDMSGAGPATGPAAATTDQESEVPGDDKHARSLRAVKR